MASITMEWESRLGRRFRVVRGPQYILSTVVKTGGMAKAARQLAMSQPAVSSAISNLEHLLGVRLLDRTARGIEPTIYAAAMLKRSVAVFDELKQSVSDVEFLSDPASGEVRLRCHDTVAATILPQVIHRSAKYPRVVLHVESVASATMALPALRSRECDLIIGRLHTHLADDDLNVEILFEDRLVVAAGPHNPLARRLRIDLAELTDKRWILQASYTWNYLGPKEAFRLRGLEMPAEGQPSDLVHTTHYRVSHSRAVPHGISTLGCGSWVAQSLPVLLLPVRPWPLAIVMPKNRTLSPVVERFIDTVRKVATFPIHRPHLRSAVG